MQLIERGKHPYTHHISQNSRNFPNFSTYSECKKVPIEYSYFELEKGFRAIQASFINRLNYWLNKCGRDIDGLSGKWIYNTTHRWAEQLNCSPSTVKRMIKSLEEQGILLSKKVNAKKYNQTKWYSLDHKILKSILKHGNTDTKVSKKKWTDRLGQNEPIIISNIRTNYTNSPSNELKNHSLNCKREEINSSNPLKGSEAPQITLRNDEITLVKQMVYLWNKVFSYSINPIKAYLSKSNEMTLFHVLNNYFEGNLVYWQSYAKMVNSSKFLMGEKETKKNFKAIFSWLIQESTIESIKSGGYGVGDRLIDADNPEESKEKQKKEGIYQTEKILENKLKHTSLHVEFEKYLQKEQWQNDKDQYGISKYFGAYMSSHQVLYDDKYQAHYNMLLKEYMAKKYHGSSMTYLRKICSKKFGKKSDVTIEMLIKANVGNYYV